MLAVFASPALNPLIKVINLISLIIAPLVVASNTLDIPTVIVMVVLLGVVAWAISLSKRPRTVRDRSGVSAASAS